MLADLDTLTLTVPQTAGVLQVSETQVRRMIADGQLRVLPGFGRRQLISKAWLARWVETAASSGRPEGSPEPQDSKSGEEAG
jgi:excisionase family DNA binding protein